MKNYHDIKDLITQLRTGNPGGTKTYPEILKEAADELETMHEMLCKQQVIIRRIYAEHLPDTWYVCGEMGEKDQNGLPQYIDVCPAYGVGWYQVYEKTDRSVSTEGS